MLKTLMTSTMLLAIALPLNAQGPGCGPTDGYCQRGTGGQYGRVCTRDRNSRLSLRTGPGQNFGKIMEIPNGRSIGLLEGRYGPDGIYWWQANYNGRQGWVRADYICDDPQ